MEVDGSFDMMSANRLLSSTLFIRPPKDNNAILIVEGNTDTIFYTSFVFDEKYLLQPDAFASLSNINISGGKKEKVIEAIKKANDEGMEGIIGIVDADFDNLGIVPFIENLYRTDTHDLESMLLKSEKSLQKVLNQYCNDDDLISSTEISNIHDILLESSKYIGHALWCSNVCKWMINFEGFPIDKFIDEKLDLDLKEACKLLKLRSKDDALSMETIETGVKQKVSEHWDLWQVCRGKEMLRVLAVYIKHNIRRGTHGHDRLRKDFLLAFDKEDFMDTQLYESILNWELNNRDYSLIK